MKKIPKRKMTSLPLMLPCELPTPRYDGDVVTVAHENCNYTYLITAYNQKWFLNSVQIPKEIYFQWKEEEEIIKGLLEDLQR